MLSKTCMCTMPNLHEEVNHVTETNQQLVTGNSRPNGIAGRGQPIKLNSKRTPATAGLTGIGIGKSEAAAV